MIKREENEWNVQADPIHPSAAEYGEWGWQMFKRASLHLLQHPCKIPIGLQILMIMMMLAMLMAKMMLLMMMADIKQSFAKNLLGPQILRMAKRKAIRVLI